QAAADIHAGVGEANENAAVVQEEVDAALRPQLEAGKQLGQHRELQSLHHHAAETAVGPVPPAAERHTGNAVEGGNEGRTHEQTDVRVVTVHREIRAIRKVPVALGRHAGSRHDMAFGIQYELNAITVFRHAGEEFVGFQASAAFDHGNGVTNAPVARIQRAFNHMTDRIEQVLVGGGGTLPGGLARTHE